MINDGRGGFRVINFLKFMQFKKTTKIVFCILNQLLVLGRHCGLSNTTPMVNCYLCSVSIILNIYPTTYQACVRNLHQIE